MIRVARVILYVLAYALLGIVSTAIGCLLLGVIGMVAIYVFQIDDFEGVASYTAWALAALAGIIIGMATVAVVFLRFNRDMLRRR